MNQKLDLDFLLHDSRAKVYLLWAVLAGGGFLATHYFQRRGINVLWLIISLFGLGYMYRVMPLQVRQMKMIFLAWLVPIVFGMAVSIAVFRVNFAFSGELLTNLGGFWLVIMASGYIFNGLADRPAKWYFIVATVNLLAGLAVFIFDSLIAPQYLIAAIVSFWSMLNLWIFRT